MHRLSPTHVPPRQRLEETLPTNLNPLSAFCIVRTRGYLCLDMFTCQTLLAEEMGGKMGLDDLLTEELPLNRKERFFTGTVLPMIVCRDNFKHIHGVLRLAGLEEPPEVSVELGHENVLFFSEYSFVESLVGKAAQRFRDPPRVKDTPDVMILVRSEQAKVLVAIEAKMFDRPSAQELQKQMDDQRNHILSYLERALGIDQVYHVALLPQGLSRNARRDGFQYRTVTWEDVLSLYSELLGSDYFLEVLRIALRDYDELVSQGVQYRKNCEAMYSGTFIYEGYRNGTLDMLIMGRSRGLAGPKLREDILSGRWQEQTYEVSSASKPINRNWFYVRDFVELVERLRPDSIQR